MMYISRSFPKHRGYLRCARWSLYNGWRVLRKNMKLRSLLYQLILGLVWHFPNQCDSVCKKMGSLNSKLILLLALLTVKTISLWLIT